MIPSEQPPTENAPLKEWLTRMVNLMNAAINDSAVPIEVSSRGSVGVPVFLQDQTTDVLDVPFLLQLGTFTIASDMTLDTRTFTASPGHGIVIGEIVEFASSGIFMQAKVMNVTVDLIEIDSLINHAYTTADSFDRSTSDMNVNGSVTPQIFTIKPGAGQSGDITGFSLVMESSSTMDYTKFGGISGGITNGCLIRVKKMNGDYKNLFNFKTNGQFLIESFGHHFKEKAGGSLYGFMAQVAIAGQHNRGVAIRLDGDRNEELQIVIQDDLSATNTSIHMVGYGSELQESL